MDDKILAELKLLNEKMDKLISVMERNQARNVVPQISGMGMPGATPPTLPGMMSSMSMSGMPGASHVGSANFNAEDMKRQIEEKIRIAREEADRKRQEIESQVGPKI